jgi:murein L,D-transpeptidase YafK
MEKFAVYLYKIELKDKFKEWDQDHAFIIAAFSEKEARNLIYEKNNEKYWLYKKYAIAEVIGTAAYDIKDGTILMVQHVS